MTGRTPRGAAVLGVALLAPLLAACSTFSANDAAATVEGGEVSRDRFEDLLRVLTENAELTQLQPNLETSSVPGDAGRQWLGGLVLVEANEQFLADHGEEITAADRQAVLDGIQPNDPVLEFPQQTLDFLADSQAATTARSRIPVPDAAELEAAYRDDPAGTGVVCLRHILVESEGAAEDVLAELRDGADFATLAREHSIDPAAAEGGGVLTGQDGGACQPLTAALQTYDPQFMEAALDARPGEPLRPVETQFGWHVIDAVPWDEAAQSFQSLYAQAAGELMFSGYLLSADITVDPRYGRWDPTTRRIVPLS